MAESKPIIVISDLHLGRKGMVLAATELRPLIEAASTLIINGDAAELHVPAFAHRAQQELDRLGELCRESGTTLLRLAGNHDPTSTTERYVIDRTNGILLTHGDVVAEAVAPWSDAASVMRHRHHAFLASLPEEQRTSIDAQFWACREASIAEWDAFGDSGPPSTLFSTLVRPRKLYNVLRFWHKQISLMDAFVNAFVPEARLILVGHSHRPRIKRLRGRLFVNTGCFGFPGYPLAGIFDEQGFRVERVRKVQGTWRLDKKPLISDPLIHFDQAAIQESLIGPSSARAEATTAPSTPVLQPPACA